MRRGLVADNGWGAPEGMMLLASALSEVLRGKDDTGPGMRLQAGDNAFRFCHQFICQLIPPVLPVSLN